MDSLADWEMVIDGDTFKVRCCSTFSGNRLTLCDELSRAVANGLLDGAVHVEAALATMGELWMGEALLRALATVPNPTVRTVSLGALLGTPDVERLERAWPHLTTAFPSLEHGPERSWRMATNPRLRALEVGPHFAVAQPNQVFALKANGWGPRLVLRESADAQNPFDALSLSVNVSSNNCVEAHVDPLEPGDVVRVNGREVKVQTLSMHRGGQVIKKGTVQWFPVAGDVIELAGLVVRYEEDEGTGPYAERSTQALFMNGPSKRIVINVGEMPDEDDDD